MWSILPVTCSALGDLHTYTKHILAHDQHYYITEKDCKKISYGLYIRHGLYINLLLPVTGTIGTR